MENDCEGFELYYQPQLKAGNYELYGAEALLRYNSPARGRVFPDEFIPVLEQSGLIKIVGMWVLREALRQCKLWRRTIPQFRVSVNFSALQFEDPHIAEKIIAEIIDADLTGDALTVEVTESIELKSSQSIISAITQLKEYNVNFAIDDFGTGYSNLGYLKQLNVDEIKIDRVFISGIEKDAYNHKLISNVIEFAKGNAIRTCCEGVEKAEELVALEFLFPDIIQGYLFDKPNTADAIERAYIDSASEEYKQRLEFVNKLHEYKEKLGVVHFDPKLILRENEVGLWMMCVYPEDHYDLHIDETMENIIGIGSGHTAKECYDYWTARIHPDHRESVQDCIRAMADSDKAMQIEFPWIHPKLGQVTVRLSGTRVRENGDIVVLEGYYRMLADESDA